MARPTTTNDREGVARTGSRHAHPCSSAYLRARAWTGPATASREPAPTLLERLLIRDRDAAREQISRMVAWEPERIVLAHGDIVRADGAAVLKRGYRWLDA